MVVEHTTNTFNEQITRELNELNTFISNFNLSDRHVRITELQTQHLDYNGKLIKCPIISCDAVHNNNIITKNSIVESVEVTLKVPNPIEFEDKENHVPEPPKRSLKEVLEQQKDKEREQLVNSLKNNRDDVTMLTKMKNKLKSLVGKK